ncbi:hypothetical protein G6F68_018310 [Rhizopus microsporus]|nr:hypothetical protein G6F68_018310 [Rhizopus microsporus]
MKIPDFLVMDGEGDEIPADPHGNHVAFNCFECGYPVVAGSLENERGSDEDCPAACRGCGVEYFQPKQGRTEKAARVSPGRSASSHTVPITRSAGPASAGGRSAPAVRRRTAPGRGTPSG